MFLEAALVKVVFSGAELAKVVFLEAVLSKVVFSETFMRSEDWWCSPPCGQMVRVVFKGGGWTALFNN